MEIPRIHPEVVRRLRAIDPALFWVWDEGRECWDLWQRRAGFPRLRPPRTLREVWDDLTWGDARYTHKLRWQAEDGQALPLHPVAINVLRQIHVYSLREAGRLRERIAEEQAKGKKEAVRNYDAWIGDRLDYWGPFLRRVLSGTVDDLWYRGKMPSPAGKEAIGPLTGGQIGAKNP